MCPGDESNPKMCFKISVKKDGKIWRQYEATFGTEPQSLSQPTESGLLVDFNMNGMKERVFQKCILLQIYPSNVTVSL